MKVDLVVAFGAVPTDIIPGVPTIYVGQLPSLGGGQAGAQVSMVSGDEFLRTVNAALLIQPEIRTVILIAGTSPVDRVFSQIANYQLASFKGRLQVVDWTGLTIAEMGKRIARQPRDTIALLASVWRDGSGKAFMQRTIGETLSPVSSIPI
jgi:hypothetical protein